MEPIIWYSSLCRVSQEYIPTIFFTFNEFKTLFAFTDEFLLHVDITGWCGRVCIYMYIFIFFVGGGRAFYVSVIYLIDIDIQQNGAININFSTTH